MSRTKTIPFVALLFALTATACAQAVPTATPIVISAPQQATNIQLPDGAPCLFAGKGATLAFEGKRVNYTCGESAGAGTVILGTPQFKNGSGSIQIGVVERKADGSALKSSQTLSLDISQVELSDGSKCLFAGKGATLAFDGKRLNHTCGAPDVGLIGDFDMTDSLWTVEKVTLERKDGAFAIRSSEKVTIKAVVAVTAK